MFAGIALFVGAILLSTDNWLIFLSIESALMVVGGTVANAFISFQPRYVTRAFKSMQRMFTHAKVEQDLIVKESKRIIELTYQVRRSGLLSLEESVRGKDAKDHMLKFGMQLLVDGAPPERVRELMEKLVNSAFNRMLPVVDVLKNMAGAAPAFGMVGTLVGLIVMLDQMAENPDNLGAGLALALLTTLYGVLFARLLLQPAADKTMQRAYIERFRNSLIVECLVMLSMERSPAEIELDIMSMVDPEHASNIHAARKRAAGG